MPDAARFQNINGYLIPLNLIAHSLCDEESRTYEFGPPSNRVTYTIHDPMVLAYREGGTTHRVVDRKGDVHCPPAPGGPDLCVVRWTPRNPTYPIQF